MTAPLPLPVPQFIARDPDAITQELIADYEARSGRTLQPAQVERLIIDLIAYRETLVRIAIQEAAQQNLVAFARYPMLDYLGEIVGVERLPAIAARTTLRFTLAAVQGADVVVPAGTRATTRGGSPTFATTVELVIPAGALSGEVVAEAFEPGTGGNGYLAGAVTDLLDQVAGLSTVANTTVSADGAAAEDDERLRARIIQAPEQFSVAGSVGAYRFHAMSASQAVVDAAVLSPQPGLVQVFILTAAGLPSAELLAEVAIALSADKVRPLTDLVEVLAPVRVPYVIAATVRLYRSVDATATLAAVAAAAAAYAAERRAGLGRDLVPSQLISALSVPGVYRVELTAPGYSDVAAHEWADCTEITIAQGPTADG